VQGKAGKRAKRRTSGEVRKRALEAYREKYADFGPRLGAEKEREVEGIAV
jgi:hypothetical protein